MEEIQPVSSTSDYSSPASSSAADYQDPYVEESVSIEMVEFDPASAELAESFSSGAVGGSHSIGG